MRSLLLLPTLAMALAACVPEPAGVSTEVATRDTTISVTATDEGEGATVIVRLVGPFGPYELAGGDALHLTIAGISWPLRVVDDPDEYLRMSPIVLAGHSAVCSRDVQGSGGGSRSTCSSTGRRARSPLALSRPSRMMTPCGYRTRPSIEASSFRRATS